MGMDMAQHQHESRTKLLDAALKLVRAKGYTATRIEDVCVEAGLTKGSFFHHFKSKEDLALAAVAHWGTRTTDLFANAPYHEQGDPLDRLVAYIDFRKAMLMGELLEFTCFLGTIIQEAYLTHPQITAACEEIITAHAKTLEADVGEAMRRYGIKGNWSAESLALHIQAVLQGGFVLAKARGTAAAAVDSLDHLRRYLELLFGRETRRRSVRVAASHGRARRGTGSLSRDPRLA